MIIIILFFLWETHQFVKIYQSVFQFQHNVDQQFPIFIKRIFRSTPEVKYLIIDLKLWFLEDILIIKRSKSTYRRFIY
ncbi:hypothetical protein BpHYR1_045920 [Brachionus plicatilis]|uniref:Uncharacterized protein n=1 Tax=Brachionus plicatilis TaxID=10195 RepID=A0A3M7PIS2_BRAPC|nr:hypothetical protein BpHYR1_045920 [Brachionus plicatilis]